MKRLIILAVAGLMLAWAGIAYADYENSATCHVFVEVDANVGVMPVDPYFDMQSIQTGVFTGIVPFMVDANTQKVRLGAAASYLYKGDDPDTVWVPPIMLMMEADEFGPAGIEIVPVSANPVGGGDKRAIYTQATEVCGFPGMLTESIVFESAQNNHFSQQVDLHVTWDQDDPEKPMGEYSGCVALFAWIVLPGTP